MKQDITHLNQPVQTKPLGPADLQLIKRWQTRFRKAAGLWTGLLVLLVACFARLYRVASGEEKVLVYILGVGCFGPIALFFAWKLASALLKSAKLNAALRKSEKEIITGSLQELTGGRNFLLYTIDDKTVKVVVPKIAGITKRGYLRQAWITLEVLPFFAQANIPLSVLYPGIPRATVISAPISAAHKAPFKMRWGKQAPKTLLYTLLVSGSILLLTTEQARKPAIMATMLFFIMALLVLLAVITMTINRSLQHCDQQISVTGIVTEVVIADIDNEGSSSTTTYSYRVDNELLPGGPGDAPFMPGDKVCFSYLINRKGEKKMLVDAIKIV